MSEEGVSLYIDSYGLNGKNNVNIGENTFEFLSDGSLLKSNSQGEGEVLNIILRFNQNNVITNNNNKVDYYL